MKKYYTRVCNFAYGKSSIKLVKKRINLPLNGNKKLSFSQIEIITRDSKKIIDLKDIKKLPKSQREKINQDLKIIVKKEIFLSLKTTTHSYTNAQSTQLVFQWNQSEATPWQKSKNVKTCQLLHGTKHVNNGGQG